MRVWSHPTPSSAAMLSISPASSYSNFFSHSIPSHVDVSAHGMHPTSAADPISTISIPVDMIQHTQPQSTAAWPVELLQHMIRLAPPIDPAGMADAAGHTGERSMAHQTSMPRPSTMMDSIHSQQSSRGKALQAWLINLDHRTDRLARVQVMDGLRLWPRMSLRLELPTARAGARIQEYLRLVLRCAVKYSDVCVCVCVCMCVFV